MATDDRPSPRDGGPARTVPGPDDTSPAISRATAERLRSADHARDQGPADVRGAIAFAIAVGTVGGLVGYLRPWEASS